MRIGFDAKRAFHNGTGLGHYSRNLIRALSENYPDHVYYLFNPKGSGKFSIEADNLYEVLPNDVLAKIFSSAWRSKWVKKDMQKLRVQLYHGLSHEVPVGIRNTGIPSVVTIHDLIHERHPEQYNSFDVRIYKRKFRYSCKHARKIIAISEQTKRDIMEFYKIPEEKIMVCYQSCNPAFGEKVSEAEKMRIKELYHLPDQFFLYVGSVVERKNLLNICSAMAMLERHIDIPLVVIGKGKKYMEKVKKFIKEQKLETRVIFLSERPLVRSLPSFQSAIDFPAIYQLATAMIYPSFFEGFGIPVLEALWSRLPVITSNVSSLPEAAGTGAYYVNPGIPEEIAAGMIKISSDKEYAADLAEKGWEHAQEFTAKKSADSVMSVYKSVW
jgi:glycosyltransferase involved in cell wall biosynthesis